MQALENEMKRRFIIKRGGYLDASELYDAAFAYGYSKLKKTKLSTEIAINVAVNSETGMMCKFELKRAVDAEISRRNFVLHSTF